MGVVTSPINGMIQVKLEKPPSLQHWYGNRETREGIEGKVSCGVLFCMDGERS